MATFLNNCAIPKPMIELNSRLHTTQGGGAVSGILYKEKDVVLYGSESTKGLNEETAYRCRIGFHLLYPKNPTAGNKEWSLILKNTIDEICNDPDFSKYALTREKIHPHFTIVK